MSFKIYKTVKIYLKLFKLNQELLWIKNQKSVKNQRARINLIVIVAAMVVAIVAIATAVAATVVAATVVAKKIKTLQK